MITRRIRIAVVQLHCHPAACIGARDFTGEPFLAKAGNLPLMQLAQAGLPVEAMKERHRERYSRWSRMRLSAILDRLKRGYPTHKGDSRAPGIPNVAVWPDVVVFPEYSIPSDHLELVAAFAAETGVAVFAGTHSLEENIDFYADSDRGDFFNLPADSKLGKRFGKKAIERYARSSIATKSLLPIYNVYDDTSGKYVNVLRPKRVLSPFEMTAAGTSVDSNRLRKRTDSEDWNLGKFETIYIRPRMEPWTRGNPTHLDGRLIRVLPLICSEALQLPRAAPDNHALDLAVFLAYNDNPDPFDPEIERHSKMKIPVAFCNDGASGGSSVTIPADRRGEYWWFSAPSRGRLPPGDGLIVMDIDIANLAVPSAINKVEDRLQLLSLAAVVPANENVSSCRVAKELRTLNDTKPAQHERNRVIEQLLNSERPTPLQELRLRRLLRLRNVNARLWEIHADDVVFGEQSDSRTGGPERLRRPTSLEGLESEMSRQCLDDVKWQLSRRHMEPEQAMVAMKVVRLCAERCAAREPEALEKIVWSFFSEVNERGQRVARQDLTEAIADFVAEFGATSAWLYLAHPSQSSFLDLVVTHNARFEPERLGIREDSPGYRPSLVGRVAVARQSMLYREIVHRYGYTIPRQFTPVKPSTRSAIAVPILQNGDSGDTLLGVLTLESNTPNAFIPLHLKELEAESSRLVSSLIILREASREVRDHRLTWNPIETGWSISRVLNSFCYDLASSLSNARNVPVFGCTVWYADWKEPLQAHARGAVRFDHEYQTRCLPMGTREAPRSFIGSIITRKTYYGGPWHEAPFFLRADKARHMELEEIIATYIPTPSLEGPADCTQPATEARALGALSFYFYSDEYGISKERARDLFEPPSVERIAEIVSRFIGRSRRIGCDAAAATARSRLLVSCAHVNRGFHTIRKLLIECLEADGCSIFVPAFSSAESLWPTRLQCVSTSGIERDGTSIAEHEVVYDVMEERVLREKLAADAESFPGQRTLRCLLPPNNGRRFQIVRENSTASRSGLLTKGARFTESFLLCGNEQRRFLAVGLFDPAGRKPLGVIRIVRASTRKPFIDADEELLERVAAASESLFRKQIAAKTEVLQRHEDYRSNSHMDGSAIAQAHSVAEDVVEDFLAAGEGEEVDIVKGIAVAPELCQRCRKESRSRQVETIRTLARLSGPPELCDGWTRQRVSAILRDVLFAFRAIRPYGVNFSIVADDSLGNRELRDYAYEAAFPDDFPLPPRAEPVHEKEGSNRWNAVHKRLITRIREDKLIKLSSEQRAIDGFCVPFRIVVEGRPVEAVLSLDLESRLTDDSEEFVEEIHRVMMLGARQLMLLAHGTVEVQEHFNLFSLVWQEKLKDVVPSLRYSAILLPQEVWDADVDVHVDGRQENAQWSEGSKNDPDDRTPYELFNAVEDFTADALLIRLFDREPDLSCGEAHGPPPRRRFGRHPYECADNLSVMRSLDARLDVDNGIFCLPLHYFCYRVGYMLGKFDTAQFGDTADAPTAVHVPVQREVDKLREKFNVMAEWVIALNREWMRNVLKEETDLSSLCQSSIDQLWRPVIRARSVPASK